MTNLEVVIGLENHVQLNTKTKMFSPAPVTYGKVPNTQVCAMDMGFPGVLPIVNKKAVELAIQMSFLLNMQIHEKLIFDRKKYYHSDLPKGFQITQQFHPIGRNGTIPILIDNENCKLIEIERLHIEEDTAKQIKHQDELWMDYNRAGIPLIEIVTKPVFRTTEEVIKYMKKIQNILQLANISDGKMNEGSLRCDVNISLRPRGSEQLGNKVEIKNLNSFNNIAKAIVYEIERQTTLLHKNQVVRQETRRFDEASNQTILMRVKYDDIDYCYLQEPNIAPITLDPKWVQKIIRATPPTFEQLQLLYKNQFGLSDYIINKLLKNPKLNIFFQKAACFCPYYETVANFITEDIASYLNKNHLQLRNTKLTAKNLSSLITAKETDQMSSRQTKQLLNFSFKDNRDPLVIWKELGWSYINDETEIKIILKEIIDNNQVFIEKNKNWIDRVNKYLMGQFMRRTKGQASPQKSQKIIDELLSSTINKKYH